MYEIRKYVHKRQEGEDERISYDSLQPTHLQHTHTQSDSTHTNTHTHTQVRAHKFHKYTTNKCSDGNKIGK